jgi:hypothetical protein
MGSVLHEVVRPDVIAVLRPKTAGAALGYVKLTLHMLDASTAACGA